MPDSSPRHHRWRHVLLLCLAVLSVGWLMTACSSNDKDSASGGAAFTFTDDLGNTVELPEKPKRIVIESSTGAALWDLGVRFTGIFGPQQKADGTKDPLAGNIDLATVTSVGQEWGEFNVEKFASLKPDLVITTAYSSEGSDLLWYVPQESQAEIEKIAPIVAIKLEGKSIQDGVARFTELAKALGADVDAPEIADAKSQFDSAAARFSDAVKAKPGLKVVPVSASADNFYVANSSYIGGLVTLAGLGLDVPTVDAKGEAWESLSWEQLGRYPADVFLVDDRSPEVMAALDSKSTWKALPAVAAGQAYGWGAESPYSWSRMAAALDKLTAQIQNANTNIVS